MPRVGLRDAELCLYSYGTLVKNGRPAPQCDYIIDVVGLRDPQSSGGFRGTYKDGRSGPVQDYVKEDTRYDSILDSVKILLNAHVMSKAANQTWLSVAIRDHHGKWLSPAIVELIADALSRDGIQIHTFHMDLEGS